MFKIVNYKKLNWFKNASENGGAMQKVIDGMQSNEVCVHIQKQKMVECGHLLHKNS